MYDRFIYCKGEGENLQESFETKEKNQEIPALCGQKRRDYCSFFVMILLLRFDIIYIYKEAIQEKQI